MTFRSLLLWHCYLLLPTALFAQRPVLFDDFERSRGDLVGSLSQNKYLGVVKKEGTGGSKAIEASYQGYKQGSKRIVTDVALKRPGEEYTLCFDVKFAEGFDFAKGGKLLGLGPDKPVAGGDPLRPDGWSARLMWREEGALISYIYHQDQSGKYGDSKRSGVKFVPGKYHAISLQVTINSDGETSDGRVAIYLDGKKQIEHTELRLRGTKRKEALIEKFLFSTFHGGSSPDWAPRDDNGDFSTEKAWFDNISVYKGRFIRPASGKKDASGE